MVVIEATRVTDIMVTDPTTKKLRRLDWALDVNPATGCIDPIAPRPN